MFITQGGIKIKLLLATSVLDEGVSNVGRTFGMEACGDNRGVGAVSLLNDAPGVKLPAKPSATAFATGVPNKNSSNFVRDRHKQHAKR